MPDKSGMLKTIVVGEVWEPKAMAVRAAVAHHNYLFNFHSIHMLGIFRGVQLMFVALMQPGACQSVSAQVFQLCLAVSSSWLEAGMFCRLVLISMRSLLYEIPAES